MGEAEEAIATLRREYQVRADNIKRSVNAIETFVESYIPAQHEDQVSIRLEKLEGFYSQYVEQVVQLQLLPLSVPAIEYDKVLNRFETKYYHLKAKLTQLLSVKKSDTASTSKRFHSQSTHIKYPELKLPDFSGNPLEWQSFHDRFNAAVHSSSDLSASEKFQYLKGLLRGEAAGLISEVPISDENYLEAWKRLVARYDDKRMLVKCHLTELFSTPSIKQESTEGVLNLVDRFDRNIAILKKLGEPTDSWSTILVYQLSQRLDHDTLREWENHVARNSMVKVEGQQTHMPKYSDMVTFLQGHARVLQAIAPTTQLRSRDTKLKSQPKFSTLHVAQSSANESTVTRKCLQCGGDHHLHQCYKFRKLSPRQRFEFVKQHHLCLNCMKTSNHGCKDCSSDGCRKCKKRHHTLIHLPPLEPIDQTNSSVTSTFTGQADSAQNFTTQPSTSSSNSYTTLVATNQSVLEPVISSMPSSQSHTNRPSGLAAHSTKLPSETVLLSTAQIYLDDCNGAKVIARVLLDSCSQFNLMTESFHKKLKLPLLPEHVNLGGVGQIVTSISKAVKTTITSRVSDFSKNMKFLVLSTISSEQPVQAISTVEWDIPSWITLADPTFCTPGPIDALLGAGTFFELLRYGKVTIGDHLPLLQNTILGWIVSGECSGRQSSTPEHHSFHLTHNQRLEKLVTRFWELDQCSANSSWSPTEKQCERHFINNVTRNEQGRYVVRLPMKHELLPRLRDNRFNAQRRFLALERKLDANPAFRTQYEEFIHEYLSLGHMREVTSEEMAAENHDLPRYYLPHHAIIRPESTTTKLRTVFDASCKSCSGLSLNDVLLAGPTIQDSLLSIVLRFRIHAFVITGDIAKMYRQILVHPADQPLQRIFWREKRSDSLKTYQLLTVTYGTNSAPFLATRVLQQLAEDENERYPLAASVIRKDLYIDDLLTGRDDLEEPKILCNQLQQIFGNAGMQLRKMSSNHREILNSIPEECRETKTLVEFDSDAPIKTLGLLWEPSSDSILYKLPKFGKCESYTKRIVLSQTSSFFDPLGLLGPAIIKAKILMQTLWKLDYEWDQPLPKAFALEWEEYQHQFCRLKNFRLPRHVRSLCRPVRTEIHGFSDASEHAYGACLYLRSIAPDGYVTIRLLAAKSRVAPVNNKSIARLELCAALLLSKLFLSVSASIGFQEKAFMWTDSMIVLHWLSANPSTWQTFVANRVAEIQEITAHCTWHHVPGQENPADLISRGMDVGLLVDSSLWWNASSWLASLNLPWPEPPEQFGRVRENELETRRGIALPIAAQEADIFSLFSSFTTFLRIGALCRRFANNCRSLSFRHKNPNQPPMPLCRNGLITVDELNETLFSVVRLIQHEYFAPEISALRNRQPVSNQSKLRFLHPVLHDNLVRVGGRLKHAEITADAKYPLALPGKHSLTRMIAETIHRQQLHCGPQLLLATIRQRFWPTRGRDLVRDVVHSCVTCVKARPHQLSQLMGSLPAVRVTQSYAFENVGIDFAGPFYLRRLSPRSAPSKSYVAVFVCMATKAAHLELVSELTTAAFIGSFRRFIARRGRPQNVYCDNATNFVGADREIRRLFLSQEHRYAINTEASAQLVKFHFIPARSPNFGGLWEACVKSMKYHLRRIIGTSFLPQEAFVTVLMQVEGCLNSRPITPLSTDPSDMQVLTPGHFLIGRPLNALPEPDYTVVPENRLRMWERLQRYTQHFWQRWHREYLTSLQHRYKWSKFTRNLAIGSIVLLQEDSLPVLKWSIGRVVDVHPDDNGIVRVASVRLPSGSISRRAISRLCLLPIEVDSAQLQGTTINSPSTSTGSM
ncbi:uncharacterized protein LOC131693407 [Topomyia yanbarensis]|uniref:uncharacterized protein LOC131693407 n=1 Tax=Topomyia yanbarensis TaxID=2498891 RepID=UPI00273CB35A|nr:uncharacterized protein LOC131693407 [Topomyia yanbarensis]